MNEEKEFRTLKTDESKFGTEKKETGQGELLEETFETKVKLLLKKIKEKAKDPRYIKTAIIIVIILILGTIVFMATRKEEGEENEIAPPKEKSAEEIIIQNLTAPTNESPNIPQEELNKINAPSQSKKILPNKDSEKQKEILNNLTAPSQ